MDPLGAFPDQDHLIGESYFDILGLWHHLQISAAHSHEVVVMLGCISLRCQELGHWHGGQLNAIAEELCWGVSIVLGTWHLISLEDMCPGILYHSCEPGEDAW